MPKAVCEIARKRHTPGSNGEGANLVVEQLEIHDTERRVRVFPDVAAEEDGNACLDQLDDCGLQVLNLGVHV
jgi:hypothetical protein